MTKPDWDDILITDTMLDWLNRTDTDRTWYQDEESNLPYARLGAPETDEYNFYLRPMFSQLQFIAYQIARWQVSNPPKLPPVWPGLGEVTLSTPVALAPGVTIEEAMDGVLVHITAVDPKQMYFTYDDVKAYRHIGALAFFSDEGDLEMWQTLGFVDAVYTPRSMQHAAGVKLMTPGGTEGTVTPWVITLPEGG
jgi:hypothetical protein